MLDEYRVVEQPAARYGMQTAEIGAGGRASSTVAGYGVCAWGKNHMCLCRTLRIYRSLCVQRYVDGNAYG